MLMLWCPHRHYIQQAFSCLSNLCLFILITSCLFEQTFKEEGVKLLYGGFTHSGDPSAEQIQEKKASEPNSQSRVLHILLPDPISAIFPTPALLCLLLLHLPPSSCTFMSPHYYSSLAQGYRDQLYSLQS